MNKRHLSRLAEEGAAEEGAAGPQAAAADPEAAAADPEAAAESLPCGTWPHLPGCVNQTEAALGIMPEDIQFECGGSASGRVCLGAAESCIDSAEYASQRLYAISQFTGVESRTRNVCKCFSSNGCRPACNVAVYTRWSATAGINCPANPPTYLSETGVYQYGDPEATYVAPEDYSFDNYPEYPNPAGHSYSTADARSSYEAEPAIGYYQRPLTASYKSGYDLNVLASGTYNPYGAVDTPRYDNDLEEATKPGGYGAF
ncbi:hypothetical protein T484DRAFT_1924331 [Baffinella frigidus]|nr:hypothetical protein T484DRAFT_1924331 [Cryptophyta sp. CCMP2293]